MNLLNFLKPLAPVIKPLVNVANTIVQSVARYAESKNIDVKAFAQSVQKVTNTVNAAYSTASSSSGASSRSTPNNSFNRPLDDDRPVHGRGSSNKAKTSKPVKPQVPLVAFTGDIDTIPPVVISRSEDRALSEAEAEQVAYLLSVETSRLTRNMLLTLQLEGIPEDMSFADYMSRFAHWGWDEESDAHAQELMNMVIRDRTDDSTEILVVFDAKTGLVLIEHQGILTLEDFALIQGREVIVVTPEGHEYIYSPSAYYQLELQSDYTGTIQVNGDPSRASLYLYPEKFSFDEKFLSIPTDNNVYIHGRYQNANGEWFYLINPQGYDEWSVGAKDYWIGPYVFGWVSSQFVNVDDSGENNIPISSVFPILPFVPEGSRDYFKTIEGLNVVRNWAINDPNGFWGKDGISDAELAAWIIHQEIFSVYPELRTDDVLKNYAMRMYDAYHRFDDDKIQQYDPSIMFFSGLGPGRWHGIDIPSEFKPDNINSATANAFAEELGDQTTPFLKMILSTPERANLVDGKASGTPLDGYDETVQILQTYFDQIEAGTFDTAGADVLTWWQSTEITVDPSPYISNDNRSDLYKLRIYQGGDIYFYLGTVDQFYDAGVGQ